MEPINFADFPIFLHPRLRIFLSADLIGSTALKHRPFLPFTSNEETEPSPTWLNSIADFYFNFASIFAKAWQEIGVQTGAAPELWKASGDELIYTKEIESRQQILAVLRAWIKAIKEYRKELNKPGRLNAKSFAWVAGFPVHNSEIVFSSESMDDNLFEADSRLRNFHLIERWYEKPASRQKLVRDFIGPSIDAGFRLSHFATAQRMPISFDLAWLLATAQFPDNADQNFESLHMRYAGREILKGVLSDQPVPLFWLDLMHDDQLVLDENKLSHLDTHPVSSSHVRAFCGTFYDRNKDQMFRPFIRTDSDYSFSAYPENYIEKLKDWRTLWEKEKGRYALENPSHPVKDDSSGQTAPPIDRVRAVLDQLTRELSDPKSEK
jgi:hypothetical protein